MSGRLNAVFAATLVDEWARSGVTDAVVAPGSRSAPLALALAGDDRIRLHVHLDERSAAFFALGLAKASGHPVVVACTSGTAAANLHPAVIEADLSAVPLLVCTANRPPELQDCGAPQTVDQTHLFGRAVRWFAQPGPPAGLPDDGRRWRALAARSHAAALGPPAGPVHLDLAFREPLVSSAPERPAPAGGEAVRRPAPQFRQPAPDDVGLVAQLAAERRYGIVVAGPDARVDPAVLLRVAGRLGWPVLADPLSGVRVDDGVVSTGDALVRVHSLTAALLPDLVLRLGGPVTSAALREWIAGERSDVVHVDPVRPWADPEAATTTQLDCDPTALFAAVEATTAGRSPERQTDDWAERWRRAEGAARQALDTYCDASDVPHEGRVARDVLDAIPDGVTLTVGSSMPIRDVDLFGRPRSGVRAIGNRGANGIDGFVSTTLGVAAAGGPAVGLLGDLTFLHDANGLLGAASRGVDTTLVVVDNRGGGIFSLLPYAADVSPDVFEKVFATPQDTSPARIAAAHGLDVITVDSAADIGPAVSGAVAAGGVRVVHVLTPDRSVNVRWRSGAYAAVAAALAAG